MDSPATEPRPASSGVAGVPRPYKQRRTGVTEQQRRREVFLARQRAARHDFQAHARRLAMEATRYWDQERPMAINGQDRSTVTGSAEPLVEEAEATPGSARGQGQADANTHAGSSSSASSWGQTASPPEDLQISELDVRTGAWVRVGRDGQPLGARDGVVSQSAAGVSTGTSTFSSVMSANGDECGPVPAGMPTSPGGREASGDVAMDTSDDGSTQDCSGAEAGARRGHTGKGVQEWYAKQLMTPEWMVDIPPHLQSDWLVLARPEGRRCLVISSNGTTVARLRNGRVLHRFPSLLPNGARTKHVAAPANIYCILDCIFHEADSTYYVLDMMAWKGYSFYNCAAEFRFYWLRNALQESGLLEEAPSHFHRFRFDSVAVHNCTAEGLGSAYRGAVPYRRDGLLFFNKYSHYSLGLTPLVLAWKDAECSQYLVDTDAQGNVPQQQQVVLEYRADATVATADTPPVVFGKLPPAFVQNNSKHLRPGLLLKFSIGPQGLGLVDGQLASADIRYEGPANQRRGGADSFSKIVFQFTARREPLKFSSIMDAATSSLMSMGEESEGSVSTDSSNLSDLEHQLQMHRA